MRLKFLSWATAGLVACMVMSVSARAEMSFRIVSIGSDTCGPRCGTAVAAEGDITDSTAENFIAFVQANPRRDLHSVVLLNSPGGKVLGSMEFGRVLRRIGALAIVARAVEQDGVTRIAQGKCFSACVYALMGARKRIVPTQSQVGVHRMFALESSVDPAGGQLRQRRFDDGAMRNVLARYSSEMGVSRELINKAETVSTDSIHVLSPKEVARWRLGSSRF